MTIVYSTELLDHLADYLQYIKDASGKVAAQKFQKALFEDIRLIGIYPLMYRKSLYFNDRNIRDITFKGYVVIYKIDKGKCTVLIMGKHKNWWYKP